MKRTQAQRCIDYLSAGHTLTPLRAFKLFGVLDLRDRMRDLRKRGHNIVTTMRYRHDGARWGEYRLQRRGL